MAASYDLDPEDDFEGEVIQESGQKGNQVPFQSETHTQCCNLQGHSGWVKALAWSPDGQRLASGSTDQTVRLWRPASGVLERVLQGHSVIVRAVAWTPDGARLATGNSDGTVTMWSAADGTCEMTLKVDAAEVFAVACAPDSSSLAIGCADGTVRLWLQSSGVIERTAQNHTKAVRALAWSPDARRLASGSWDWTVKIGVPTMVVHERTLKGHSGAIWSAAWSPDGRRIATGSDDATVKIWNSATGTLERTLHGHTASVCSVAWTPDCRHLASSSDDRSVMIWRASAGTLEQTLQGHSDSVWAVAWSPDGQRLASGGDDQVVKIWLPFAYQVRSIEGLSTEDLHDRGAALLCDWLLRTDTGGDRKSLPTLCVGELGVAHARLHATIPADIFHGTTSSISILSMEFPRLVELPAHAVLFVIVRDSGETADWLQNLNISVDYAAFSVHNVAVHQRFSDEIATNSQLQAGILTQRLLEQQDNLASRGFEPNLVVAGHSQAGGVATALFGNLRAGRRDWTGGRASIAQLIRTSRLVTFGAPMAFSHRQGDPSPEFLEAMRSARNYVHGNDPVARAFSAVSLSDLLRCFFEEKRSGPRSAWEILRSLGAAPASAEAMVDEHVKSRPALKDFKRLAMAYRHYSDIVLLASRHRRSWKRFDVSSTALADHEMKNYFDALLCDNSPPTFPQGSDD